MIQVPLVMYKDGERIVIGVAAVTDNGQDFEVDAKILPEYAKLLATPTEEFSVSPEKSSTIAAEHAAMYGCPVATPASIGAWAQEVERYSNLDTPDA